MTTRIPRKRILRTILRGCRRLNADRSWPTGRQWRLMYRHRAVTAAILQSLPPPWWLENIHGSLTHLAQML